MALRLRPKANTLGSFQSLRLSSSSSSSPSPPLPPPSSNGTGAEGGGDKDEGSPPSYASLFSKINARFNRQPPSTPRRIPLSRADPPPLGSAARPSAAVPIEEVRRHLSNFSLNGKPPPLSSSSSSPISFQDIYKSNALDGSGTAAGELPSFESIRESLRQQQTSSPTGGVGSWPSGSNQRAPNHPLALKSLKDSLNLRPAEPTGAEELPDSIFGRELLEKTRGKEDGKEPAVRKMAFFRQYDFEELGEKLRRLRLEEVDAGKKKKKGWFSLEELNERLAKLRELDENERECTIAGISFKELRDSLVTLKDADEKKRASSNSANKLSILASFGGQGTPAYMLKPPKEHLVEKYFHPDHLSAAEKLKLELKNVRDEFKMSESDCGSTRVQVAQLTTRIRYLEPILYTRKKGKGLKGPDKHSIKGLVAMVKKRNKLLKYLRRTDWESYCMVLSKLDLRDIVKKEVKITKGSKEKKRGKKGKGKYSKQANYET